MKPAPRWAVWLAIAALVVAAYSAGKFSGPEQTSERVSVVTAFRDRVIEKRVEVESARRDRVVYRERVIHVDGSRVERETEREIAASERKTEAVKAQETVRVERVEIEKRIELRPDWRVSVQAGASLQAPAVPIAGPLVLGAQVDRRIVGGVSAGVWINTSGAAGVAVSVEF